MWHIRNGNKCDGIFKAWLIFFYAQNLYKQQQKLFQQQRIVQSQRLKRVRQLLEDYTKNLQEMKRSHEAQHVSVQEQLRKEVNMLQKKILSDTVRCLLLVEKFN